MSVCISMIELYGCGSFFLFSIQFIHEKYSSQKKNEKKAIQGRWPSRKRSCTTLWKALNSL